MRSRGKCMTCRTLSGKEYPLADNSGCVLPYHLSGTYGISWCVVHDG
jgi:hypothetical protein